MFVFLFASLGELYRNLNGPWPFIRKSVLTPVLCTFLFIWVFLKLTKHNNVDPKSKSNSFLQENNELFNHTLGKVTLLPKKILLSHHEQLVLQEGNLIPSDSVLIQLILFIHSTPIYNKYHLMIPCQKVNTQQMASSD